MKVEFEISALQSDEKIAEVFLKKMAETQEKAATLREELRAEQQAQASVTPTSKRRPLSPEAKEARRQKMEMNKAIAKAQADAVASEASPVAVPA